MDTILKHTKRKFLAVIILSITAVVAVSWGILFMYSTREIASPANSKEIHKAAETNQAYADYLEEQKDFEAHFVTLASDIKRQEADRIQGALLVTTVVATFLGIVIALYTTRKLIYPVKEAYDSQERFIQDAAHELRNPLAAMTVSLQQAPSEIKKTELYKTFQRQTKRLIGINEDLLFLERHTSDKIVSCDLDSLLQDVVEELQPLAMSKDVTLKVESSPGVTKMMSQVDYIRLVKNIIDNAIKYSKKNSVVSVTQSVRKNTIELTVKDRGIGIPKKELSIVGERFFRAKNTGNIDGTGLGLSIVQKILNVYGGTIAIESTVNKGTLVRIKLPA